MMSCLLKVSYKEFRALVLHPNPGVVDLLKEVHKANENEVLKEKQALAGKKQGLDHNAFHRQKEMTQVRVRIAVPCQPALTVRSHLRTYSESRRRR